MLNATPTHTPGKDVEKSVPLYTDGENISYYNHYGDSMKISLKIKKDLSYDLAISLLRICAKKLKEIPISHVPKHQLLE